MSEEATVNSEDQRVTEDEHAYASVGHGTQVEKLIPVSEAIRYRKRAQAAEKELLELKELHEKQGEELAVLKGQTGRLEDTAKQSLTVAPVKDSTGENMPTASVGMAPNNVVSTSHKTQGVKETRTRGARGMLQNVAKQAAGSGSRSDVQEYLRVRRQYV